MLDVICNEIHNYFTSDDDMWIGDFSVVNGAITPPFDIQENQYFRIVGSVFNDGVYKYTDDLRLIDEDIFMEYYSGKDVFEVEEFCNFLDYEIGKCDPTIYVYVGNTKSNYDKIDKRIKTIYSDDIYKGVKIVYLNKMYDFSLS